VYSITAWTAAAFSHSRCGRSCSIRGLRSFTSSTHNAAGVVVVVAGTAHPVACSETGLLGLLSQGTFFRHVALEAHGLALEVVRATGAHPVPNLKTWARLGDSRSRSFLCGGFLFLALPTHGPRLVVVISTFAHPIPKPEIGREARAGPTHLPDLPALTTGGSNGVVVVATSAAEPVSGAEVRRESSCRNSSSSSIERGEASDGGRASLREVPICVIIAIPKIAHGVVVRGCVVALRSKPGPNPSAHSWGHAHPRSQTSHQAAKASEPPEASLHTSETVEGLVTIGLLLSLWLQGLRGCELPRHSALETRTFTRIIVSTTRA